MKHLEEYATLVSSEPNRFYNEAGYVTERWQSNDGQFVVTLAKARGFMGGDGWLIRVEPPVDARYTRYQPVGMRNRYAAAKRVAARWLARRSSRA